MAKKTTTKKTTTKKAPAKSSADKKAPTKSQIYTQIAETTNLSKKDVAAVFDELGNIMKKSLGPRGPQEFTIPGLAKVRVVKKPGRKAGVYKNPFTGEDQQMPAKPASKAVKLRPLKGLKDMV